jgi:hypothetical protein
MVFPEGPGLVKKARKGGSQPERAKTAP